jgi:beta-phosphoglucomutase
MARDLGVIFDMDGVLIDSTEAHYEAWRRTGVWLGVPYPRPLFDRTFGMHNRQSIALWLGKQVDEAERQRIADYKESMYREAAKKSLRPIPGVLPLLHALAAEGFHLAVGSSGPSQNVQLALELIGAAALFEAISCGDDVTEGKPHPAIFLNAARKLNLEPWKCAVIEDAPPGIEAAHNAGMAAIAIPTSRTVDELRAADLVVQRLDELTPDRVAGLIAARQKQPKDA